MTMRNPHEFPTRIGGSPSAYLVNLKVPTYLEQYSVEVFERRP